MRHNTNLFLYILERPNQVKMYSKMIITPKKEHILHRNEESFDICVGLILNLIIFMKYNFYFFLVKKKKKCHYKINKFFASLKIAVRKINH